VTVQERLTPRLTLVLTERLSDSAEQPAIEVNSHNCAPVIAGEEAALPLESARGDDVLVLITGQ
jgi:hypothetical protein